MKKINIKIDISAEELKKKLNIKDGITPKKGVDYFDGQNASPVNITGIVESAASIAIEAILPKLLTIDQVQQGIVSWGTSVRDSLELLNGNERLDISAIQGFDKFYDEVLAIARKAGGGGGVGAIKGLQAGTNVTIDATNPQYPKISATGAAPAGTGNEVQYRINATTFGAVKNSVVLPSPNLSEGSMALPALNIGSTGTLSYALGGPRFKVTGDSLYTGSLTGARWSLDLGGVDTFSPLSDFDVSAGSSIYLTAGVSSGIGQVNIGGYSGVYLQNLSYGSVISLDDFGGVTVRAYGDTGGLYADLSGYTYVGYYAASAHMTVSPNGGIWGSPNANDTVLFSVGSDPGTGSNAFFDFSLVSGGSSFVDFNTQSGYQIGFRIMQGSTTAFEFGASGSPGEYFTNSDASDAIFKGNLAASNTFRFGVGSGNSQMNLNISELSIENTNFKILTAGKGIYIKTGTNATAGVVTLVGGTAVVSTNKVTANSIIQLTGQNIGTVTVGEGYNVSTRTAGTSFTIKSSVPTDTSIVGWLIIEPA